MPIHDHSYRHWKGELKSHGFRWWVITKEGLRIILRRKLFLLFILAPPAIHFFATGAIVYGVNIYGTLFGDLSIINAKFLFDFLTRQSFSIVLICVFGGAGLIANDLKNNALQFYFSKPLTRLDYLAGKLAIVMVLVGLVTVVPGVLLFVENAVLSKGATFLREKYWVAGSIALYSLILTLSTSLLILALSAMTRNGRYAAVCFIAILVGTPILSEMLKNILKLKSAVFVSYWSNLHVLGRKLFGLPSDHHWYWAMLIILGLVGLCVWIMYRKVNIVEIVK